MGGKKTFNKFIIIYGAILHFSNLRSDEFENRRKKNDDKNYY
jgi:hypothetical protein